MEKPKYQPMFVRAANQSGYSTSHVLINGKLYSSPLKQVDGTKIVGTTTAYNGIILYVIGYTRDLINGEKQAVGVLAEDVDFGYSNAAGDGSITLPVKDTSIFSTRNILIAIGITVAVIGAIVVFKRKSKITKVVKEL